MTSRSSAKKTLQSFHARTTLWRLFEIRAEEMDCSVDYLINEAMRLYANSHGFLGGDDQPPERDAYSRSEMMQSSGLKTTTPGRIAGGSYGNLPRPGGPPRPTSSMPPSLPRPGTAPGGGAGMSSHPPSLPRPGRAPVSSPGVPPGVPLSAPGVPVAGQIGMPNLTLIFQGRKIHITGTQFIIGRGSKASDLAIKDANISRKHAAIIYHNGAYYLKDLGSTNGIEYKGKQVDSKRIDEGDVFSICGYELHFTYGV